MVKNCVVSYVLLSHTVYFLYMHLVKVKAFWSLMSPTDMPGKISRHASAWGLRKLMSHVLRALRLARAPRELYLQ